MKIGIKLILAFLVVSSLIAIVGMISYDVSKNILINSIGNNSIEVAVQVLDKTDLSLHNNLDLFQILSKDQMIQSYLIKSNESFTKLENPQQIIDKLDNEWISEPKNTLSPLMLDLINNELADSFRAYQKFFNEKHDYSYFGEIFVTNAFGVNIAQTSRTSDYKQNDEVWWQSAKEQGIHVGPIEFDQSAGIFARDVSIRITDDDGIFLGVVKHVVNVQEIFEIIDDVDALKKFETQQFTLLDENFNIIYSTDIFYDDSSFLKTYSNTNILEKIHESSDYFILPSISANDKLISYTNSNHDSYSNWILLVDYDVSEILAPVYDLQFMLMSISGIATVSVIIFGVYISRTISKPINLLRINARKIADGDYNIDVHTDSTGEILELQKDIKKMAVSLSEGFENIVKLKIAEQRELEFKLVEKQKDEFAAMVTHELKTPLTPILSWCGLFKKGILGSITDKQKKAVDKIESNAHKLKNLLDDMLDSEKSSMEQMTFTFTKFNSTEFIKQLVENYQETMKQENIEFIFSSIEDIDITSDKSRIEQIMKNFVLNALDFVPKENGRIEIKVEKIGVNAKFSVIDNGMGVPEEKQKDLFKKFYQINTSMTRKHGGSGLGLSICKGIVKGLRGTIEMQSTPNVETIFHIEVPIAIPNKDILANVILGR